MSILIDERPAAASASTKTPTASNPPTGVGETAAALLDALGQSDLVYLAGDEPSGRELFRAVQAGAPDALVVFVPPTDSLPGESAPATPANAGERTAALRRIHAALAQGERPRIALVSTGEAAARLTAPPEALGTAPPIIHAGQEVDL